MANISYNTIRTKNGELYNPSNSFGINFAAGITVQSGVDGAFAVQANQIAWGEESIFNGSHFGGTSEGLLTAIENSLENNKLKHFDTLTLAKAFLSDPTSGAAEGQVITVGTGENISLYLIKSKTDGETTTLFLEEAGGSTKILASKTEIESYCNNNNKGKQFYVEQPIEEDGIDEDGQPIKTVIYSAGLYVVTGSTCQKLSTSSATGDYGSDITALQGDVSTIYTTLNSYNTTLTDHTNALALLNNNETIKGSVAYTAKEYADTSYNNAVSYTQNLISDLKTLLTVNSYNVKDTNNYVSFTYSQSNGLVNISDLTVSGLATTTYANELGGKIDTLDGKVTTLVGEDTDKSVREIASAEVAKIVADADTSYDTLKEISDWIIKHPEDVAAMNTKIDNIASAYVLADTALSNRIDTLEKAGYITEAALTGYATETFVTGQGYITEAALTGYATETFVTGQGYITQDALTGYATQQWVIDASYVTQAYLSSQSYVQSATLDNYFTKEQVTTELNKYVATSNLNTLLDNYLDTNGYLTADEANQLGFAKANEVYSKEQIDTTLSSYAKSSDITTLTTAINTKANAEDVYTKEAADGKFATKEQIPTQVSAFENDANYITLDGIDFSTTYAAYHSTYTLESLGTEIDENAEVTAKALNDLETKYNDVMSKYSELKTSFDELLAKVAIYDNKFGYVAATDDAAATFKYEYLRIDDYEDEEAI